MKPLILRLSTILEATPSVWIRLAQAAEKFATFKPASDLVPNWGQKQTNLCWQGINKSQQPLA